MDLQIHIELQDGLLLVTASGNLEFTAALQSFKEVVNTAAEKQVNKILINGLGVDGELSTVERYNLGGEVAKYLRLRKMNPRLAIVGKPPTVDGFGVLVGQNLGVMIERFSSEQEALNWLCRPPS